MHPDRSFMCTQVTQWTLTEGAALPSAAAPSFCECLFDEALEAPQPLRTLTLTLTPT